MLCGNRQINYHLTGHHKSLCVCVFSLKKLSAHHLYFYLSHRNFLIFLGAQALFLS